MNRRAFLGAGVGVLAAAVAAPYAPLLAGDEFEAFAAGQLGMEEAAALETLARLRERLGDAEYDQRAAAFAVALRAPYGGLVPGGLRRAAIERFVGPLFAEPPDRLAYVLARPPVPVCGGLLREA